MGYLACTEGRRNANKMLILKWLFNKQGARMWTKFISEYGPVISPSEHSNKPLSLIIARNLFVSYH
jgi:hypothetical protein